MFTFSIRSLDDWDGFAAFLLPHVKSGMILTFIGPLGAGKTTCIQALARALGSTKIPTSPTFSLLKEYRLTKTSELRRMIHVDAYRLERPEEAYALNLDEELEEPGTLLCIEWPEHLVSWLAHQKPPMGEIVITPQTSDEREVRVRFV